MKKIYVGNISYQATEIELRELFEPFGTVDSVKIITDRETGKSRGFCFIEMENAETAISELNDTEYGGRNLRISEARERKPRDD